MPLSFDEYTSRPVFFQPDGEPQQSLFHDDNNLLEFSDAIFEATENGWGFYADVQATADASKYPIGAASKGDTPSRARSVLYRVHVH